MSSETKNLEDLEDLKVLNDIIRESKSVVVDFWAPWCGPCKHIAPVFDGEALHPSNRDVVFCKVNIEKSMSISKEFKIKAIPTFMCFKGGKKVDEATGADVEALRALITQAALDDSEDLLVNEEATPESDT